MNKNVKWKVLICAVITVASLWFLAPTLWSLSKPGQPHPKWMSGTGMKLGLDLQGGVHLVLNVDVDKVIADQLTNYGRYVARDIDKEGVKELKYEVNAKKLELELRTVNKADNEKVAAYVTKNYPVLRFMGETENILVLQLEPQHETYIRDNAIQQSIETIRNRIDEFGVSEPNISRKGDTQILVQFPGAQEPERLKKLIGQTAKLDFQIVHGCVDNDSGKGPECLAQQRADLEAKIKKAEEAGKYNMETFQRFSEYRERLNTDLKAELPESTTITFEKVSDPNVVGKVRWVPYLLSTKDVVSGEFIEDARVSVDQGDGFSLGGEEPRVNFQMNAAGTPILAKVTGDNVRRYMAIVLDGLVKSAPILQSSLPSGSGQITLGAGGFDDKMKEARDLSLVLRAGALPAQLDVQEERVIGPSMGKDAIAAGKMCIILTGLFVFFFMWGYYGMGGLIANLATMVNVALIFAILGSIGATLTLPGIAGIALTLGMAVDALIIIYERMREEARAGRKPLQVVESGFEGAFSAILDSNLTTAIGAMVLLQYGTGTIRGFALTLLVGIVVNVFIATFFTKTMFQFFVRDNNAKIKIGIKTGLKEATA